MAKRVVIAVSVSLALILIAVAILWLMGYPFLIFESDGSVSFFTRNSFAKAFEEYHHVLVSVLGPLDPSPPQEDVDNESWEAEREAYLEAYYNGVAKYFIDNDFTDELNTLEELIQKAEQGDKDAKNQREYAKASRAEDLAKMRGVLEGIKYAIAVSQKYDGDREINVSIEDSYLFLQYVVFWTKGFLEK